MMSRRLLITVGTTQFGELTDYLQLDECLSVMQNANVDCILLQVGSGNIRRKDSLLDIAELTVTPETCCDFWHRLPQVTIGMQQTQLGIVRYIRGMEHLIGSADLVVSHCGAGTTMEALTHLKPLCLISNPNLAADHQAELGEALQEAEYATFINGDLLRHDTQLFLRSLRSFVMSPKNGSVQFAVKMEEARRRFEAVLEREAGIECLAQNS